MAWPGLSKTWIFSVVCALSFFLFEDGRAQYLNENTRIKITSSIGSETEDELRETIANNMLIYQRNVGGWPKHNNNVKIDYSKKLSAGEIAAIGDDVFRNDATIDNGSTVKEIRFLAHQFKITGKKIYLEAVEKGLDYLLKAQYSNGGWPQFYPDLSLYRHQITYNDHAMVNVLNLMYDVNRKCNDLENVNQAYITKTGKAVKKGIDCILKTQIKVNGRLTAWCAQHDEKTLQPAKARSFELASLSSMESVGILYFLMRQEKPSEEIKNAVIAGVAWLDKVKVAGYNYVEIADPDQPGGRDRRLVAAKDAVVWSRFYTLESFEPFFCGRDGVMKKDLGDIEHERRIGYAWYGTWPDKFLNVDYSAWLKSNG